MTGRERHFLSSRLASLQSPHSLRLKCGSTAHTPWHTGDLSPDVLWPVSRACFALLSTADYCHRHTSGRVGANQQLPPEPSARDVKASALGRRNRLFVLDGPWIMGGGGSLHGTAGVLRGKKTAGARKNILLPSHWGMPICLDIHTPGFSIPLLFLPFTQWMKKLKKKV